MDSVTQIVAENCAVAAKIIHGKEIHLLDLEDFHQGMPLNEAITHPVFLQQVLEKLGFGTADPRAYEWVAYSSKDRKITLIKESGLSPKRIEIIPDETLSGMMDAIYRRGRRKGSAGARRE